MKRLLALLFAPLLVNYQLIAQVGNPEPKQNTDSIDSLALVMGSIQEQVTKLDENYYVISRLGAAGNIGMFVGETGVYLIDNQWATLADKTRKSILKLTPKPIKTIINTHFHYDHSHGNLAFGRDKVSIIAHTNARLRMTSRQVVRASRTIIQNPYPQEALPTVTITDRAEIHEGGETLELLHARNAHTDGDLIIHFKKANLYHTGDIFVRYGLPFIDQDAGGHINGVIEAVDYLLTQGDDKTRYIPGHGAVCSKIELLTYRTMLSSIRDQVMLLDSQGKPLAEIINTIRAKLDSRLGGIDKQKFITQVYSMVHIQKKP